MNKKLYILFVFLGMAVFTGCLIAGGYCGLDWLILAGIGICAVDFIIVGIVYAVGFFRTLNNELKENARKERTADDDEQLLDEINGASNREENMVARAKFYGAEADSSGELIAGSFGFSKSGRQAFKSADFKDKLKVVALFGAFGLLLLSFMAGIVCANVGTALPHKALQTAGFILMGVGGGGFFLIIIILMIISSSERRSYYKSKAETARVRWRVRTRVGVVTKCELHSQNITGNGRQRVSGTLYQIWVFTDASEKKRRFVCSRRYAIGDRVKFYENKFGKCELIETDPVDSWGKK